MSIFKGFIPCPEHVMDIGCVLLDVIRKEPGVHTWELSLRTRWAGADSVRSALQGLEEDHSIVKTDAGGWKIR